MELQEEPSFEYVPTVPFFDGSCTFDPSICLQVNRFLIWSHEDGGCCGLSLFCCFFLRLDCCFLVCDDEEGSGKKVKRAIKSY